MWRHSAFLLLALLVAASCGEKDLIDDGLSSEEQVRSLVEQFQDAVEAGDDKAACEFMSKELRADIEESMLVVDGEPQEVSCGAAAALRNPEAEESSLPGA